MAAAHAKPIELIFMKNLMRVAVLGLACVACLGGVNVMAQAPSSQDRGGRGNFKPAQFKQQRLDGYKERLEIKDDTEWKAIQPLVEKVMELEQSAFVRMVRGFMFSGGGRSGGDSSVAANDRGDQRGGRAVAISLAASPRLK